MNTLTESQIAAIKCAFVDLCASYKAWEDMDVYSHDWKAHSDSIDELLTAFPFLEQTKKDFEEEGEPFNLVECKNGSSLRGYITTTFDELVKCFGEPNHNGDGGYKVSFEWAIQFADGTYATIYDWKLSPCDRLAVRNGRTHSFNIGGFNSDAVIKVHEAMGIVHASA